MTASTSSPASLDRCLSFLDRLGQLEQWLGAEQIPYAVFGSVAAAAWIDQGASLDFDRPGAHHPADRIPDIDLLVPRASLDRVNCYARTARHSGFQIRIDTFWSECWIDFQPGSQFSYLTHRKVRIPVRTELFTPVTAWLLGQQVAALDPRTLLHIYGTVGVARRKDAPRIAALTEALASGELISAFTDQDCQAFGSFRLARTRRYPLFFAGKRTWVMLTDALPPRASQALTHHVQRRADTAFRMLSRHQRRQAGVTAPGSPAQLTAIGSRELCIPAEREDARGGSHRVRIPVRGRWPDQRAGEPPRRLPDPGPELEP